MPFLKLLAIAIVIALLWEGLPWLIRHWRLHGLSDFHRWLKDPSYRRRIEENFAKRRSVTVPDDVTEATIRSWVLALAGIGKEPYALERLRLVGDKAKGPLVEALGHPAFLTDLPDDSALTENGLDKVFDLLREIAPVEAVPRLAELVDHHDVRRVKDAALLLGCIADEGGLPALAKALRHDDDYVRSYALMGLEEARGKNRGTRAFWTGVYPHVVPLIDREDRSINRYAPLLVVSIEPEEGLRLLLTRYCTRSNRRLQYTIAALRTATGEVPAEAIDSLLADLDPVCSEYPWDYAFAELLRLMASRRHPRAEELALRYLEHAVDTIREGAADALVQVRSMSDPARVSFDRIDKDGFDSLTEPQRTVYCVRRLVDEVNNGGLAQYLGNSSGDHASEAVASLERIGATALAGHLRDALRVAFGAAGPSSVRDKRMAQIAKMGKPQDAAIEGFDQRLYKGPEPVETLMMKYALAHAEDFRTTQSQPA